MNVETNLNAVIMAFGLRRPNILDVEGVFGRLIDAVADLTRRAPACPDGSEVEEWAARFLEHNRAALDLFAAAFISNDYGTYSQVASELIVDPLPAGIITAAARRETYDLAVVRGLESLGLQLVEMDPRPDQLLFYSVWAGHDGGRLEVHEYDGLPVHIVTIEPGDAAGNEIVVRRLIHVAPINDPEADAAVVVSAATALWT